MNLYRVSASTGRTFFDGTYTGTDPDDVRERLQRELGGIIRVFWCTLIQPEPIYSVIIRAGEHP